jgi:uncharacterized protein (TIGR00299 family) protein
MKVLYYDCFSGISGDMNLAAMIDLGVDRAYLEAELKKLGLDDYTLTVEQAQRKGIYGTQVHVLVSRAPKNPDPHHVDHTPHRHLAEIRRIIEESTLSPSIKELSMKIFMKIAEAEAKVHHLPVENIHFHEVGAVDSLIDIVGAAICFHALEVDKVQSSTVELGGGFVDCDHGRLPVPAPATAEIVRGMPVSLGRVKAETTTPTGAAILSVLVDEFTDEPCLTIEKIGYGIGHRDTEIPNVLRVFVGQWNDETQDGYEHAMISMTECNIDDMNPEYFDYVSEKLFALGADDVFLSPVTMKRGRPATMITVLSKPELEKTVTDLLMTETTTLGVRSTRIKKTFLEREFIDLDTRFGPVKIKVARHLGKVVKMKPEYSQCKALAENNQVPLHVIYEEIQQLLRAWEG